jgi:uncharacterized OsmC-like protein
MLPNEKIRAALTRVSDVLTQRPEFGQGTKVSTAKIVGGLTCEITEGDYTFIADMPRQIGGEAAGPTPGVYGRAALGSCIAIGYMMKAAAMNIPVESIEVEIQADFDDGALLGTAAADVPPGYLEVRYSVTIDSDAPQEAIIQMLDEADRNSPYLDVFRRAQTCRRQVNITKQQHM